MSIIAGTWTVVSSPDFDEADLRLDGEPYITLRNDGEHLAGAYHVGLQHGYLSGRQRRDGSFHVTFEGFDEMDEVHGAAAIALDGSHLILTLMYHDGDDYSFKGVRQASTTATVRPT